VAVKAKPRRVVRRWSERGHRRQSAERHEDHLTAAADDRIGAEHGRQRDGADKSQRKQRLGHGGRTAPASPLGHGDGRGRGYGGDVARRHRLHASITIW
jgi:hypothetical protein